MHVQPSPTVQRVDIIGDVHGRVAYRHTLGDPLCPSRFIFVNTQKEHTHV